MLTDKEKLQLNYLIVQSLENLASPQEFSELDSWLKRDKNAVLYYAMIMELNVELTKPGELGTGFFPEGDSSGSMEKWVWEELAKFEREAEPAELPVKAEEPEIITGVRERRRILSLGTKKSYSSLKFLGFSLAALFILLAFVTFAPRPAKKVAVLSKQINARWDGIISNNPEGDSPVFYSGKDYILYEGIARLFCLSGPEIIIEAPCRFSFTVKEELTVLGGKAFLDVPKYATGYTVYTPDARIQDLGTAFGVDVDEVSGSSCQVSKGKVNLSIKAENNSASTLLAANEAGRVDSQQNRITSIPYDNTKYIRHLSSETDLIWRGESISLAGLLNGQNGFTFKAKDIGIDPSTGNVKAGQLWEYGRRVVDSQYNPVPQCPEIDGVFVMASSRPVITVSSMNHTLTDVPKTTGVFFMYITAVPYFVYVDKGTKEYLPFILNGVNYSIQDRKSLIMCPNVGITFDLNKIRQTIPGLDIESFEAVCGCSDNCPKPSNKADFYVLLDGKKSFYFRAKAAPDRIKNISIPIQKNQRFLTLAVSDGGDSQYLDWTGFGSPELKLKRKE